MNNIELTHDHFTPDFGKDLVRGYLEDDYKDISSFTETLSSNLNKTHSNIIFKYPKISSEQKKTLLLIFEQLIFIQDYIDPDRLKPFSYTYNNDEELLLFRKTDTLLINLVIYTEGDFALSVIDTENKNSLEFFESDEADYEMVVYKFLQ